MINHQLTGDKPTIICTVCIERFDFDGSPWVSSFSSRAAAIEFKQKIEERLNRYSIADGFLVTIDAGPLDDEQYLDWLDDVYGEEDTHDDQENP